MTKRLIKIGEVKAKTGLGKTKIYELLSSQLFPQPIKIGASTLWSEQEIETWIQERLESRGAA